MPDFEVIVVDDGSVDDTVEIVNAIKDERLRCIAKANEERAVARNTGAAAARGEYVTFLDSDDIILKDHLAVAVEVRKRYSDPEIFHLGYQIENPEGTVIRKVNDLPERANERMIDGNMLSCNGVFVRRDIALKFPFNTERALSATEDYELWLRLASRFPIYCDNRITSVIKQHDARSVVSTNENVLIDRINILERSLASDEQFMDKFGGQFPRFKSNNSIYMALHLALMKHRASALSYLAKALKQSPSALQNRAFYGTLKRLIV
jgi:glycosyltransferase involved in cell wall biosynthesis